MASTHFGFKTVDEREKAQKVRGVFDSVASKYDVMNDLMSGGLHRWWKRYTMAVANPQPGQHALDIAGGTGICRSRLLEKSAPKAAWCTPISTKPCCAKVATAF